MQSNHISMSECGSHEGFGECDEASGRCMCSMGWTGPDCSEATCCPLWVFILSAVAVLFVLSLYPLYRHFNSSGKSQARKAKEEKVEKRQKELSQRRQERLAQQRSKVLPADLEAGEVTTEPVYPLTGNAAGSAWAAPAAAATPEEEAAERARRALGKSVEQPQRSGPPDPKARAAERAAAAAARAASEPKKKQPPPPQPRRQRTQAASAAPAAPEDAGSIVPEVDLSLSEQAVSVQNQMREQMTEPLDVRKQFFRELLLEYHPDKNSNPYAKEVFQVVNDSKTWFLRSA